MALLELLRSHCPALESLQLGQSVEHQAASLTEADLQGLGALILHALAILPALSIIDLNLAACLAFVGTACRVSRSLMLHGEAASALSHTELTEEPSGEMLDAVTELLARMFAALLRFVVLLDSDRFKWKVGSDLGFVLGLILGLGSVTCTHIENVYEV